MHVHASCPIYIFDAVHISMPSAHTACHACHSCLSMFYVHASCSCCISMLNVHASRPCRLSTCMSQLHVCATCSCCLSILHVHTAYPCYMSLLHVHPCCISKGACQCLHVQSSCQCCFSMLHVSVVCSCNMYEVWSETNVQVKISSIRCNLESLCKNNYYGDCYFPSDISRG
jgi:hypothetical protein